MEHCCKCKEHPQGRKVKHAEITGGMTADQLAREMAGCGFGARKLGEACDILEAMQAPDVTKFFGLSGAMVPSGMRRIVSDMIRDGHINVLVTTGANMVHDIIEATGGCHTQGYVHADDLLLRKQGVNRIYDVFLADESFNGLEERLGEVFANMAGEKTYSIREVLTEIGRNLDDRHSILRSAYDAGVPVYCPAIQDSVVGLRAWEYNHEHPDKRLRIDALRDMDELLDTCYKAERTGALLLGGGVPKNYILQCMLVTPRQGYDYVIQITMDRAETGGLSGATLEEALSWGKVTQGSRTAQLFCDSTIALPIMLAAVKERLNAKGK